MMLQSRQGQHPTNKKQPESDLSKLGPSSTSVPKNKTCSPYPIAPYVLRPFMWNRLGQVESQYCCPRNPSNTSGGFETLEIVATHMGSVGLTKFRHHVHSLNGLPVWEGCQHKHWLSPEASTMSVSCTRYRARALVRGSAWLQQENTFQPRHTELPHILSKTLASLPTRTRNAPLHT